MPDTSGSKIFISYRRDDAGAEAGRLSDDLQRAFGDDSVFLDVVGIQLGRDFRKAIHQNVGGCGVLLAVIGPQWASIEGPDGTKRLTNANDYVRLEIATALQRDIPVIPVLVRGATLPPPEALPGDLQEMVYRNSVELTHTRWHSDVALLTTALKQLVADQAAEEETKRQAAEQERQAEAQRLQQIEAQRRQQEVEALAQQAATNQRLEADRLNHIKSHELEKASLARTNAAAREAEAQAAARQQAELEAKQRAEAEATEAARKETARIAWEEARERARAEVIKKQQEEREAARIERTKQKLIRETEERVAARAAEKLAAEHERLRSEEAYKNRVRAQFQAATTEQPPQTISPPTFATASSDTSEGMPTILKVLVAVLISFIIILIVLRMVLVS